MTPIKLELIKFIRLIREETDIGQLGDSEYLFISSRLTSVSHEGYVDKKYMRAKAKNQETKKNNNFTA
jgi:hypothetical protein